MKDVPADKALFSAGDFNNSVVGLMQGVLAISWDHPQLHHQLVHFARPGFWTGDGLAYGLPNRMFSARTKTDVCLICLPRKRADELIAEDPRCLAHFGRLTMLHVEDCLKVIGELLARDPLIRVTARLVAMCGVRSTNALQSSITLPFTQDDLAELLSLSRKTLNRALRTLRSAGAIRLHYGSITVLDFEKLCSIASASPDIARAQAPLRNLVT